MQKSKDKPDYNHIRRQLYAERVKLGLCPRCGRVPIAGLHHCYKCRVKKGNQKISRYNKLKSEGRCTKCGKKTTNGTRCKKCATERNARRRKKDGK